MSWSVNCFFWLSVNASDCVNSGSRQKVLHAASDVVRNGFQRQASKYRRQVTYAVISLVFVTLSDYEVQGTILYIHIVMLVNVFFIYFWTPYNLIRQQYIQTARRHSESASLRQGWATLDPVIKLITAILLITIQWKYTVVKCSELSRRSRPFETIEKW